MAQSVVHLDCPGCGAPASTATVTCEFCERPIVISTFTSVADMAMPEINKYASAYRKAIAEDPDDVALNGSLAMCYLKLKLYDKAIEAFEAAIVDNFDNSEMFFYSAVVQLRGKKAFLASRAIINQVEEYLDAAIMIEPRGIYHYFRAYVKYDYYARKHFGTSPTYEDALATAIAAGYSENDVEQLYVLLGVQRPEALVGND